MRTIRASRLVLASTAMLAVVAAAVPVGQGADPFVAGGRSTRPIAFGAGQVQRALSRGAALAGSLGLPGVDRRAERLDDRFEHRVYDEVVAFDRQGREASIARFDPDGRVVMAVVLGEGPKAARAIGRGDAGTRGAGFARAAGVSVAGTPKIHASAAAGGWMVDWGRSVDGVPVRGDGVRVALWSDGSFHGLTRTERPLAAAPAQPIGTETARATAVTLVSERFGASATQFRIAAVERAWVAPNDTWAPLRPDAPDSTLRLAWVVRFEATGALADRIRMAEYWFDAGDGSLLGGDVAE